VLQWESGIVQVNGPKYAITSVEACCLSARLTVPIVRELIPEGIEYGSTVLVEFRPDSLWYETSLTIAAQALRDGLKTAYHAFQQSPTVVRDSLSRLGLDVMKLEHEDLFRIIDSYTAQTGLEQPERQFTLGHQPSVSHSVKLTDWSIDQAKYIKAGYPEDLKRWLHIDDNFSIMNRYNQENTILDWLRTRDILENRASEMIVLHSLLEGVGSESFRGQMEALHDIIVDFKSEEQPEKIEHYVRLRLIRGKRVDARWRKLSLLDNGEVSLVE
jgi:KaiC/GvpD/RAD55 family RecA-like ATPase